LVIMRHEQLAPPEGTNHEVPRVLRHDHELGRHEKYVSRDDRRLRGMFARAVSADMIEKAQGSIRSNSVSERTK